MQHRTGAGVTSASATPNNAPQVAALAALSNLPYIERVRDALVAERGRLFEGLQAVPFLQASRGALLRWGMASVLDCDVFGASALLPAG